MVAACRAIAQQTRADRHTLMFSATWPSSIQKLASEFLSHPVKVTIGSQDLSASHSVTQVRLCSCPPQTQWWRWRQPAAAWAPLATCRQPLRLFEGCVPLRCLIGIFPPLPPAPPCCKLLEWHTRR